MKDRYDRTVFQEKGDPFPVAFGKALAYFSTWTWRAWRGAIFEYRKARKQSLPFHAVIPVDDPILSRLDDKSNPNPDDSIPQDEPSYTVYRTEGGKYFTESYLKNPKFAETLAGARITQVADISDERAFDLVMQLDALEMDVELTENEKLLRAACQAHLAGLAAV